MKKISFKKGKPIKAVAINGQWGLTIASPNANIIEKENRRLQKLGFTTMSYDCLIIPLYPCVPKKLKSTKE